jgi:hypothetical protein
MYILNICSQKGLFVTIYREKLFRNVSYLQFITIVFS